MTEIVVSPKPESLTSVAQWAEKEEPRNLTRAAVVRRNRKAESDNVRAKNTVCQFGRARELTAGGRGWYNFSVLRGRCGLPAECN